MTQQMYLGQGGAAAESLKVCDAADFDGTNDYMRRTTAPTGSTDSKTGIVSAWLIWDTHTGNPKWFCVNPNTTPFTPEGEGYDLAGKPGVFLVDATGTILDVLSDTTLSTGVWYHILCSWDLAAGVSHFYVNDVSHKTQNTNVNRTCPWSSFAEWTIGDYSITDGGGRRMDGGMAELYIAPNQFLDFSVQANRRKFISSGGKPIDLGATGSTPTGTAPLAYCHLDDGETANNFATNRSGNGNLTVTGALTTRATSPSD